MKGCRIEGCEKKHYAKGYCHRHWAQMQIHGKVLGNPKRSRFTRNEFIFEGNICKIKLYDRWGVERPEQAIVDIEDYEKIKKHKWCLSRDRCVTRTNTEFMQLQHFILDHGSSYQKQIDHKDLNRLNNRRSNLRICSNAENCKNRKKYSNNTSGYKGVFWHEQVRKWTAKITVDYKQIYLGLFTSKKEAALNYNVAAKKYHGKFARLNNISAN